MNNSSFSNTQWSQASKHSDRKVSLIFASNCSSLSILRWSTISKINHSQNNQQMAENNLKQCGHLHHHSTHKHQMQHRWTLFNIVTILLSKRQIPIFLTLRDKRWSSKQQNSSRLHIINSSSSSKTTEISIQSHKLLLCSILIKNKTLLLLVTFRIP